MSVGFFGRANRTSNREIKRLRSRGWKNRAEYMTHLYVEKNRECIALRKAIDEFVSAVQRIKTPRQKAAARRKP
jgi:hypothetical protein